MNLLEMFKELTEEEKKEIVSLIIAEINEQSKITLNELSENLSRHIKS